MAVMTFWLFGLLAIGGATFLIGRTIQSATTIDQGAVRAVMGWGAVVASVWIFFGLGILIDFTTKATK